MYTDKQVETILRKLKRLEGMLHPMMFESAGRVEMSAWSTKEAFHHIPDRKLFLPCSRGQRWEGEGIYCWFGGSFTVPDNLDGQPLYIFPKIKGYEGFLWVNGRPYGNFTSKYIVDSHGNHYCDLLVKEAKAGEVIDIVLEYYAHHYVKGTQPFEEWEETFEIVYDGVKICTKDELISNLYYDLRIADQMAEYLPEGSFRKTDVIRTLIQVHGMLDYDIKNADPKVWREAAEKADRLLQRIRQDKNAAHSGYAGLIGHSHMDTAWLWEQEETIKKCARTYANQLALMDQYPDYTFIQSSALHAAWMEQYYPDIFQGMKKRITEGRYEPNGGVWVECDCNIPGGEFLIRQFLLGQRYTMEKFGYRADVFWLPDTFGYSASLPQIMKGCGIRYFLTTKLGWNDTNVFPYDTFYWEGIDRSRVLVHTNRTHIWPDPQTLLRCVGGCTDEGIKDKTVTDMRLLSYGFGDGGGGPEFEMIELANRLKDVEGLPRTEHVTVSSFMESLERQSFRPPVYSGELYLELHRGTLTNQHRIKQNNRLAEIALRNLEYFTVVCAVEEGKRISEEKIRPLVELLLVNQFHDILPGTCIPRVHDRSLRETSLVIEQAQRRVKELLEDKENRNCVTVYNTLSFDRNDVFYLYSDEKQWLVQEVLQQATEDITGKKCLAVANAALPAFGSRTFAFTEEKKCPCQEESPFIMKGNVLKTPYYEVKFDEKGYIGSLVDLETGRELRGDGYALNTFLIAEDVPAAWDNWDVDADIADKWRDDAVLLERKVVSQGAVEIRIRSSYRLTDKSVLKQDMVFYSTDREIVFFTEMDWQDDHRFLKAAFDTSVQSNFVRNEVQFGYTERSTHQNTKLEKAKFEVSNHKYSDLSEPGYGAALLNDCKYGISVEGSGLRLSLHKGGCRPDDRGDKGLHTCAYAFLPHGTGFSAESVVRPAYAFNIKPVMAAGKKEQNSFLKIDAANVVAETVKPMEEGNGYVIRLYEAEGTAAAAMATLGKKAARIALANMLEEEICQLEGSDSVRLYFRPFEIKTLCVFL